MRKVVTFLPATRHKEYRDVHLEFYNYEKIDC